MIKIYQKIDDIKEIWLDTTANKNFSFFQSYEWNKLLADKNNKLNKIRLHKKMVLFYVADREFIAPLLFNKKNKTAYILGYGEMSDYLSFIWRCDLDKASKHFNDIVDDVINSGYRLSLSDVKEDSLFYKLVKNSKYNYELTFTNCVRVDLSNITAVSFYETLSKNSRSNYRNAVNRLKKDYSNYSIVEDLGKIQKKEAKHLFGLYKKRRIHADKKPLLIRLIIWAKSLLLKVIYGNNLDILSNYSFCNDVFVSKIIINNEIACFFEGIKDGDTMYVVRVATNKKYNFYSPGQILFCESLDHIRGGIKTFDLTRGAEPYKIKLGGALYKNAHFIIYKQ